MGSFPAFVCILLTMGYYNYAYACTWMKTQNKAVRSNFQYLSNNTIFALQLAFKGRMLTQDKAIVPFPNKIYTRAFRFESKLQISFIFETLNEIKKLYHGRYETADCDQTKLEIFLMDVDRQTSELQQCGTKSTAARRNKILSKFKKHFKYLKNHLKSKNYSASAWNDVTALVVRHLGRLDILANSVKDANS